MASLRMHLFNKCFKLSLYNIWYLKKIILPLHLRIAPVAQLDRAPDYGSGGLGFDSLRVYQMMHLMH